MGFIKEVFYGNISPGEQTVIAGARFDRLEKTCDTLCEELKKDLSEDNIEKFKQIDSTYGDIIDITAEENYVLGFRDGARMILDVLAGENENLRPLIKE